MPPRTGTRIVVECPGCSKAFSTEQSLRMHRSHPTVRNRPCYLKFRQEPRISAWAPGAPGAAGQLDVSMGDFQEMYGGGRYQSESPEPGDDLRDPPSDFDEDLLGAGQPPGGGAAASAPRPPDQVYVHIWYNTYIYVLVCTTFSAIYVHICTYMVQYVHIRTSMYHFQRLRLFAVCLPPALQQFQVM